MQYNYFQNPNGRVIGCVSFQISGHPIQLIWKHDTPPSSAVVFDMYQRWWFVSSYEGNMYKSPYETPLVDTSNPVQVETETHPLIDFLLARLFQNGGFL